MLLQLHWLFLHVCHGSSKIGGFSSSRCVHRGQFSCRMNEFSQVRRVCFSTALSSAMKSSAMMSSAMMFSFLGYEFQTRELQIVRQVVCSVKKRGENGQFLLKTCGISFFSRGFNVNDTYLFRGNFLVKLPKILPKQVRCNQAGDSAQVQANHNKLIFFFRQNKPPGQTLGRIVVF